MLSCITWTRTGAPGEIARLLAPGGVAVFREVQAGNVCLRLFRYFTPFWRTPDEHPLTEADYAIYRRYMPETDVSVHVFTSLFYLFLNRMVTALLRLAGIRSGPRENARILAFCDGLDNRLARLPGMKSQMWFSLIEMRP